MTRMRQAAAAMSTTELEAAIYANAEIQKRNPFDSKQSMRARVRNRPLFAEMATRSDAPAVK